MSICVACSRSRHAGVPPEDDHHAHLKAWLAQRGYEGRYVRKTRRYGGSWPLQIGNALFWRRDAFAYLEHEEVHLAALLAAACDEEVSSSHFGREPQVGPLSLSPSLRLSLSPSLLLSFSFLSPSLSPLSFSVSLSCLASVSSQPISSRPHHFSREAATHLLCAQEAPAPLRPS